MISFNEVRKLNKHGNVIPIYEKLPADLDTPVSAFMKLARKKKESFLLESIEGGEKLARYSFVGFDPFLKIECDGNKIALMQGNKRKTIEADPLDFIRELFSFYKPVKVDSLPRFTGGGVGYFSYDSIRLVEDIPDTNNDEIQLPDIRIAMYQNIVVFDHLKQEILVIANILHDHGTPGLRKKYECAVEHIKGTSQRLSRHLHAKPEESTGTSRLVSRTERKVFERNVRKAKKYIKEGDIFQVVLSQRWHVDSEVQPLTVYRRLRRINPSPYMFLLNCGTASIIGSSPEMMVRVEKGNVETRPIAGTRPRGRDDSHDARLMADLMNDEKELAEHTMLLDLGRNDIGRVSKAGTVEIKEKMIVEKYSHVMHIVSSVQGKLRKGCSPVEGLFSCFPAGTVSGAPKIRAMEIIDELESERRGIYAGAVAYLDFWGNLDSCITIRTVVRKNNRYYLQAGAGIVADSKPAREFDETKAKARALIQAVTGRGL